MKRWFLIATLAVATNLCMAQKYTVRNRNANHRVEYVASADSVNSIVSNTTQVEFPDILRKAARYHRRSANCRAVAFATGLTGCVLVALGGEKKELYWPGFGLMGTSLVFEIISINYHFRSGVELEASANSIRIKF